MLHNNRGFPNNQYIDPNQYIPTNSYEMHDGDNNPVAKYPLKLSPGPISLYAQPTSTFDPFYQQTSVFYDERFNNFCHIPDVVPHQISTPSLIPTQEMPSCSVRKIGLKRKASDVGLCSPSPAKIKIDEAKMAASMSDLNLYSSNNNHIINNNNRNNDEMPWFSTEEQCQTSMDSTSEASLDFDPLSSSQRNLMDLLKGGATLKVKDEFDITPSDILPKSVVDEIVKPGLQLVLWKPPGEGVLGEIKKRMEQSNQEDKEELDDIASPQENMMSVDVPCYGDIVEDVDMDDLDDL